MKRNFTLMSVMSVCVIHCYSFDEREKLRFGDYQSFKTFKPVEKVRIFVLRFATKQNLITTH